MEEEKRGVSSLVFISFVVLFVLFLFLNPNQNKSGNVVIGSIVLGENPSIITIVILFVILVVILAAVFVIFKKLKKKKIKFESPKPTEIKQSVVSQESKKEEKVELESEDIEKLFSNHNQKIEEQYEEEVQPTEKKVMINLQDLKNKIKGMLSQSFTKEQIIGNLKSQGFTMDQISKTIDEVNIDNLRDYVSEALKQGLTRDQIVRNLAMHGWKQEQISKVI